MVPQRTFTSVNEPSLEAMEAMLMRGSTDPTKLCASDVLSDEVIKIPIIDGIGVGSWVSVSTGAGSVRGVVLHFNKHSATIALTGSATGSVSRGASVELLGDVAPFKFGVAKLRFNLSENVTASKGRSTHVPVVDWLLGDSIKAGTTVGIYAPSGFRVPQSSNAVVFPTTTRAVDMYIELITLANKAVAESLARDVTLVVDLRSFEQACRSLEFQVNCPLPVSVQSLVASVLQLAHTNDAGHSLSVVAVMNAPSDFSGEAAQSVDIPIQIAGDNSIANLHSLLTRFSLRSNTQGGSSDLVRRLLEGFDRSAALQQRQEAGVFVDYWETDELESFNTLLRLLPRAAAVVAQSTSEAEKLIVTRAMSVLFFNKTQKRNSAQVDKFCHDLIDTFKRDESALMDQIEDAREITPSLTLEVDEALIRHRYSFELCSPIVD